MPSLTGSLLYACGGAPGYENGFHLYAWGAPRYMDGVFDPPARVAGARRRCTRNTSACRNRRTS